MIRLLIESLTILGCLNLSKVIYVILINKTNFSQLIFYLIYLPIGHLVIFNYLGFKWAFIQKPLPFNHFKNRVYQCSCVGIVWLYLIISIIANHQGYIALTLSQILFGIVLVILYYQLIFMQLRPNQYFSDKQISFLTACQIKLFGKTNKATFELKILLVSVNVMVFLLLIYMLFGIFNVPNHFFYMFHDIISSTITIGTINFSLLDLMLGVFAFSCIVCVESVMTHLLLQQKINHTPSSIFKTQINFIHYFFKALALIIALLIIGIQSSHLMVIIGSLGLGAGFGLQFIIENLLSGIFIIIKKNFLVGDTIKVINTVTGDCIFEGKIVHIYSMETLCINKDQNQVILPNATLFRNEVIKLNEETTKSS